MFFCLNRHNHEQWRCIAYLSQIRHSQHGQQRTSLLRHSVMSIRDVQRPNDHLTHGRSTLLQRGDWTTRRQHQVAFDQNVDKNETTTASDRFRQPILALRRRQVRRLVNVLDLARHARQLGKRKHEQCSSRQRRRRLVYEWTTPSQQQFILSQQFSRQLQWLQSDSLALSIQSLFATVAHTIIRQFGIDTNRYSRTLNGFYKRYEC